MRSPENIEKIRQMRCSVCLKPPPSDPHHWRTRGAGGTDMLANLVSLCHQHHVDFHTMGRKRFSDLHLEKINKFRRLNDLPEIERRD